MIHWYYRDEQNQEVGPLTPAEFEVCVVVGEIYPETAVWRTDLPTWTTYERLLEGVDEPVTVTIHGRHTRRAPRSRSYGTQVALGASAIHRRARRSQAITSGCTPWGVMPPVFQKNTVAEKPRPSRLAVDAMWLGRQFIRIALAGAVLVLANFLWTDRTPQPAPAAPPEPPLPAIAWQAEVPAAGLQSVSFGN